MEEASLVLDETKSEEMLQQLRDWQEDQKKRLAEQQAQQRLLLLEKQKKLLSMINSAENTSPFQENYSPSETAGSYLELQSDEGETETPRTQQPKHFPPSVDDVPLKRPRAVRSFQQLLETSLTNDGNKEESGAPNGGESGATKKFPFLKRGQGISRFGSVSQPQKTTKKPAPSSSKSKGKENKAPPKATKTVQLSKIDKPNKTAAPKQTTVQVKSLDYMEDIPAASAQVVPYQKPEVTRLQVAEKSQIQTDLECSSTRTEEDLAVFELLERFASINASFSSSSSLIGQLIDKGVTHLPSPSKVLSFLSKRRADFPVPTTHEDEYSDPAPPKSLKTKHVHFAESVEENEEDDLMDRPWLSGITEEVLSQSHPSSLLVSNKIQTSKASHEPEKASQMNLDETPTSPIGFPDYQKLFGNPARTLWDKDDDLASPDNDSDPRSRLTDPDTDLREAALPPSLPIEDPRLVYQNSLIRSRLVSLEREIATYRRETDSLRRARKEHDDAKLKLEQEQEKFRRYADNEKRRLQLLYTEEQKKVRSEQLKDLPILKDKEQEVSRLKEELKQAKEEHRGKENKWMASQNKMQEKVRSLELRVRELTESLEKLRNEEQNLRRRLNASLRPGAMMKGSKTNSTDPASEEPVTVERFDTPKPMVSPSPGAGVVSPKTTERMVAPTSEEPRKLGEPVVASPAVVATGAVSSTVLPDGTKLLLYPNGNRKEIWPDGKGTQVIYYNGDIKQKLANGFVVYTYADSGTKHTTKPDGTEILEFSNGQIETTYPDGRSQVQYLGGAQKMKYPDGREEAQWPDGTKLWTDGKGHGVMTFPSGMREIYTPICKRREYPDGTVKTVYEDGRSETRYGNGRIRVKDARGNIITDTGEEPTQK